MGSPNFPDNTQVISHYGCYAAALAICAEVLQAQAWCTHEQNVCNRYSHQKLFSYVHAAFSSVNLDKVILNKMIHQLVTKFLEHRN